MSLATDAALAVLPAFVSRVQMASTQVAVATLRDAEAADHAKAAGRYFLREPEINARKIAWLVAAHASVPDNDVSDDALIALIGASWTVLAGVLL